MVSQFGEFWSVADSQQPLPRKCLFQGLQMSPLLQCQVSPQKPRQKPPTFQPIFAKPKRKSSVSIIIMRAHENLINLHSHLHNSTMRLKISGALNVLLDSFCNFLLENFLVTCQLVETAILSSCILPSSIFSLSGAWRTIQNIDFSGSA